jgi:opacity protein-like surface antigen
MKGRPMRHSMFKTALCAAFLFGAHTTFAQESAGADVSVSTTDIDTDDSTTDDSSAFLLAGKVGGILPFADMSPFVSGGLELGYVFGGTERRIAAMLDVTYTTPLGDGHVDDARFADGGFDWELTQKALVFQPTFLYRLTGVLGDLTPYAGIGPRLYLLQTVVEGKSGSATIERTDEQSTKFGFGVPLGIEYALGPGGLMAELLFQWGPLDHRTTGDTHLASTTLLIGYRALL